MTTKTSSQGSQAPRSADLHPGPGFRLRSEIPRAAPELMRALAEFDTPEVSDQLNRLYAIDPEIHGLSGVDEPLVGPACTVRCFPGDNLMVHKVLDVARPGDVVVIGAGGTRSNAVLGDIISTKARHRGIAGFVVDGLVRDLPAIQDLEFPVYARGTTPIGPLHRGPGEINFPIACGGVVVNPGDVILADAAGVVVVPRLILPHLVDRLQAKAASSAAYLETVRRGDFSNAWVDVELERQGCSIEEPAGPGLEATNPLT